jgi:competence protein ComEC
VTIFLLFIQGYFFILAYGQANFFPWFIVILITLYWFYKRVYAVLLSSIIIQLLLLIQVSLAPTIPTHIDQHLFIIETKSHYVIAASYPYRWYIPIDHQGTLEVGDLIRVTGQTTELKIATYESRFNFQTYLKSRGVHHQLMIEQYEHVWHQPIRFSIHAQHFIQQFNVHVQPFVARLLFHQSVQSNDAWPFLSWISTSGLGLSLAMKSFDQLIQRRLKHNGFITSLIFFPFMLGSLNRFSLVRAYSFFWIDRLNFKWFKRYEVKYLILLGGLIVFPHIALQTGMMLYIAYVIYYRLFFPLIEKFKPIQYILTLGYTFTIQWGLSYIVHLLPTLLFLPLLYVHQWIFLILLFSYYGRIVLPFIDVFLTQWVHLLSLLYSLPLTLHLGKLTPLLQILFIGGLLLSFFASVYRRKNLKQVTVIFTLLLMTIHFSALDVFLSSPSIHFMNVGQGDATLIRYRHHAILIDTGGQFFFEISEEVLIPYFKKIRVRSLDAVIITHNDFDHNGGLPYLKSYFPIKQIIDQPFHTIQFSGLMFTNLNHGIYDNDNDRSLVISVTINRCHFLVMGDVSIAVEKSLIRQYPHLNVDVLRIGHHGSNTSTSLEFLLHTTPKTAIISLGATNRYGHPHNEVIERLKQQNIIILRTDLQGTIVMQSCKI